MVFLGGSFFSSVHECLHVFVQTAHPSTHGSAVGADVGGSWMGKDGDNQCSCFNQRPRVDDGLTLWSCLEPQALAVRLLFPAVISVIWVLAALLGRRGVVGVG